MKHLWTPWRSTYINSKKEPGTCVFCFAQSGTDDRANLVVHRGQHCFVILNRYPYTSGHLMVAPYSHVSRLAGITDAAAGEMMQLTRLAEKVLEHAYRPDGLNVGMNLGEAAGAGIEEHIHMHVLPRWRGDANFMTSVSSTRILPESLTDTYEKLNGAFQGNEFNKKL
jgi:ATP adenylyltransferase